MSEQDDWSGFEIDWEAIADALTYRYSDPKGICRMDEREHAALAAYHRAKEAVGKGGFQGNVPYVRRRTVAVT